MSAVYDIGTISVTNGSTTVTGAGTAWVSALRAGWLISLPNGELVAVASVNADTSLTLVAAYTGTSQSAQAYWAIPTGGIARDLAAAVEARNSDVQTMLDGPGAGRFGSGTAALPGVAFAADLDTGIRRSASNELAITTGGVDRAVFSAATGLTGPVVQSGPLDDDIIRLMKVGAFGLGANVPSEITDFTVALKPGFYRYSEATAIGAPGDSLAFSGSCIVSRGVSGITSFLAVRQTPNSLNTRAFLGVRNAETGPVTWTELWHSGNTVVDANANGTYIRYPNGFQICRHEVDAGSVIADGTGTRDDPYRAAPFDWTYPAAFDAAPTIALEAQAEGVAVAERQLGATYFGRSATQLGAIAAYSLTSNSTDRDATVIMTAIGQAA